MSEIITGRWILGKKLNELLEKEKEIKFYINLKKKILERKKQKILQEEIEFEKILSYLKKVGFNANI